MNRIPSIVLPLSLVVSGACHSQAYTTVFPLTENPISEGGKWANGGALGLDWTNVSTTPGLAIGHEIGLVDFSDGTALLSGSWGPDQSAMATVYSVNQDDACYEEVELRLRSSLSAHACSGYEISEKCTKTSGAYLIIVRWNGPFGDFTYLRNLSGAQYGVASGDSVRATIVGNVITAYINGIQKAQVSDDTYKTGNPGIGFNLHGCTGKNSDYGYTRFTASAGGVAGAALEPPPGPRRFVLGANYPNPFNPSTTIRYELPGRSDVTLEVFDPLGRKAATLAAGIQEPGTHEVRFDGAALPSGVYFYRLRAGRFVKTMTCVLLR